MNPNVDPSNPKETLELVEAILTAAQARVKITEDGKLGLDDLTHVIAASPKLYKGILGGDLIDDELAVINDEGQQKIKNLLIEFKVEEEADIDDLYDVVMEAVVANGKAASKLYHYFKNKKQS